MTCTHCKHCEAKRFGFCGRNKIQRYRSRAWHLYVAFLNFCCVQQTLRVTPATLAAITEHVWSVLLLLTWAGE
jgi:hypothetical protein